MRPIASRTREGVQSVHAAVPTSAHQRRRGLVVVEGREAVVPDMWQRLGRDAAAAVADADRDAGRRVREREHLVCGAGRGVFGEGFGGDVCVSLAFVCDAWAGGLGVVVVVIMVAAAVVLRHDFGERGDGDFDGFALLAAFDGGAERVLQQLGDDVFEVYGDVCELVFWFAFDHDVWADAVFQLTDLADHVLAVLHNLCRFELGVDHADEAWGLLALVHDVVVWLA